MNTVYLFLLRDVLSWTACGIPGESLLVETAAELAGKDDDCDWLG